MGGNETYADVTEIEFDEDGRIIRDASGIIEYDEYGNIIRSGNNVVGIEYINEYALPGELR